MANEKNHNADDDERPPYCGPERRASISLDRVALLIEEAVDERIAKMEDKLMLHINQRTSDIHVMMQTHISEAFPHGPLHKHREYHQGKIESAELAGKIKSDILGWVAKGVLAFVMGLLFLGAKDWMQKELGVKTTQEASK